MPTSKTADAQPNTTEQMPGQPHDQKPEDVFLNDWRIARDHWKSIHNVWNYSYLTYRSISAWRDQYGEQRLKGFGIPTFIPRTYQTVESIHAHMVSRTVEFTVKSGGIKDRDCAKHMEKMDNIEWIRCGGEKMKSDLLHDILIMGMAHVLNVFEKDVRTFHFPVKKLKKEKAPISAAIPETPPTEEPPMDSMEGEAPPAPTVPEKAVDVSKPKEIQWEEREIVAYEGMKPKVLNTFYTFPDPLATGPEDRRFAYIYTPIPTVKAREFVVLKGWMTQEEAEKKIVDNVPEYFDEIRCVIDWIYQMGNASVFTKGDHRDPVDIGSKTMPMSKQKTGMTFFLERLERDYYECRVGEKETIYKDFNIYPHKKIPIVTFYDTKLPHEDRGMGEPEIIRHQQIEENRIHDLTLKMMLIMIAQRYAINPDLMEDETDLAFDDPFKPIRIKSGIGADIRQAFVPLNQPHMDNTPFELMALVKDTIQSTTGASDFLVSSSDSATETATESNNLMAATTGRLKSKFKAYEAGLSEIVNQWHACYPALYSNKLELYLSGDDAYYIYLPYDRKDAETNQALIQEASTELNAVGETLSEIYKNAGYKDVIYASDATGNLLAEAIVADSDLEAQQEMAKWSSVMSLMDAANKAAQMTGQTERFDIFKFAKEMVRHAPMIRNVDEYVLGSKPKKPGLEEMAAKAATLPTPGMMEAGAAPVSAQSSAPPTASPQPAY